MTDQSTLNIEIKEDKARADLGKLSRSLDKTTKAGNRTSKAVKKTGDAAKTASGGFNVLKGTLAGVFTTAALAGLANTIAKFETLEFSLGVVFKSMDRGKAVFKDIQTLAEVTPFALEDLTTSVIKLRAAGIEPTTQQLTLFSDVASVTTDAVGSLTAITDLFSRTTAGGLGLMDLNRLADRGIPVFDILKEKLGLARLEVVRFGASAQGSAKILAAMTEGLEERFGGASLRSTENLTVAISNLGDGFDALLKAIGDAGALNLFKKAVFGAITAVEWLSANLDTVAVALSGLATLVLPAVIKAVKALTLAMAANPVGLIVVGITAAITAMYHFRGVIFDTLIKTWEVWLPNAIDHTLIAFVKVEAGIVRVVNSVLRNISKLGNTLIEKTPDFLKGWLGIEGHKFELEIDMTRFDNAVTILENRIARRISSFKAPPRPDIFGLDDDKKEAIGSGGEGLSTSGSLVGDRAALEAEDALTKKQESQLQTQLQRVEESLFTEEERLFDSYANRQFIIDDAFENELVSQEKKDALMLGLKVQYETELLALEKKGWTDRQKFVNASAKAQTQTVINELINMTAGVAQHNKTMFEINKVAGIANATVGAIEGANRTMGAYPYPLNVALAGLSLAAGMANVAAIQSTSFGGGGGTAPSGVTGGAGAPAAEVIPQTQQNDEDTSRAITINVEGNVYANDDFREALVEALELAQQNDEVIIHAS